MQASAPTAQKSLTSSKSCESLARGVTGPGRVQLLLPPEATMIWRGVPTVTDVGRGTAEELGGAALTSSVCNSAGRSSQFTPVAS